MSLLSHTALSHTARKSVEVVSTLAALSFIAMSSVSAQPAPALKVGDMAPDFSVTTVTSAGVESKPFKLSEHRGETVVLAFFPRARTSGCTTQMETYRDQYAQLFMGGKKVSLVGVSTDADSALTSWARDAKFPFRFAADIDRTVGVAFGVNSGTGSHKRHLYVIDPQGRIALIETPFRQMSADAYTSLGAAIAQASSPK